VWGPALGDYARIFAARRARLTHLGKWLQIRYGLPYHVSRNRSQYLHDHPDAVQALMTQIDPLLEVLGDWWSGNRLRPLISTRCVGRCVAVALYLVIASILP
jgi:hypothetical protein